MSTPKNAPRNLPEKTSGKTGASEVLERLKAARPTTTQPTVPGIPPPAAPPASARPGSTGQPGNTGASASTSKPETPQADSVGPAGTTARERTVVAIVAARAVAGRAVGAISAWVQRWDPDLVRQIVLSCAAVACLAGAVLVTDVLSGPASLESLGGALSPDGTLLIPAPPAFALWSIIYVGLFGYTLYQWLPRQRTSIRQRNLGWIASSSMLFNLAWLLSVRAELPGLGLASMLLLLGSLLFALHPLNYFQPASRAEGLFVDTVFGLYLGWVLVNAFASAAAQFQSHSVDLFDLGGQTWALVSVVATTVGSAVICMTDRGRLAVAVAVAWGLGWIAVDRLFGEPHSGVVAFAAGLSVFLLLISAGSRRHRVDHSHRRWLRAQQDAARAPIALFEDDVLEDRH